MRVVKRIKLKAEVQFTEFLSGHVKDLGGEWVDVLEVNKENEHLSIASVEGESHLVNVDPRDIADEAGVQSNTFVNIGLFKWVEEILGRQVERSSQ